MTTPVLFLDDASRFGGQIDRARAESAAMSLIATLKALRKVNKKFALNTAKPISQYQISEDWTLQAVLGGREHNVEWEFIRSLSDRSPFAAGLEGLLAEVNGLEFSTQTGKVSSSALAWAILLESATVSFDAHPDWSQSWVDAEYSELDDNGNLTESTARVRNASRVEHADDHVDWLKLLGLTPATTAAQIWNEKAERLPGLRFLPRVEKDIVTLEGSGAPFLQAISALEALSRAVVNWTPGVAWPQFSDATPEAEQRQRFCSVMDDVTAKKELFDWHSRFTGGLAGRIHFRVDTTNRQVVVGYVGAKLTRAISP